VSISSATPAIGSDVEGAPDPTRQPVASPSPVAAHPVWLVRHAPTSWTGRRWCGRADPPLSRSGRAVAARVAAELGLELPDGIVIRSSPARRARSTAEAIAGAGRPVVPDDDLLEVDVGAVEGLTWDEVSAAHPDLAAAILAGGAVDWPGGEPRADVEIRARRAARRIALAAAEGPVVVVSHGALIQALRMALEVSGLRAGMACPADPGPLPAGGVVRLVPDSGA
jgi:broad specificity phosphatase PhoE